MPNRLANQTSPYLRMHGEDPVDWYPWGQEAFERARDLARPIFLSIGYASCHWCHVMQRESFRDPATAETLNSRFVSIKVDRESRPDVDELYMAYVVTATGHGGWPMNVFLTPRLLPIFGGTYFPPEPAHNLPSFLDVLDDISAAFSHRPHVADNTAEQAIEHLREFFQPPLPDEISRGLLHRSADDLIRVSDHVNGGFGSAPKFPLCAVLDFLLAYHTLTGDERSLEVVVHAVQGIIRGGIFDQVGGGLARYSVDDRWLVPHFEKMLYDNGQMLSTLARLQAVSPSDEWVRAIRMIAGFLARDLATSDATFMSSLSADTAGQEGGAYVWTYEELADVLSSAELALAEKELGVTLAGNWEGRNILTRPNGRENEADAVDAILEKLLTRRSERAQPEPDTKVLVNWNALAACGLLDAGLALHDASLSERGLQLTRHLLEHAITPQGDVVHLLDGEANAGTGIAQDATALARAAATAYHLSGDGAFVDAAAQLLERAESVFADSGVWYMTPQNTELPLRPLDQKDSPTPASASLAAGAATLLWRETSEEKYRWIAEDALERLAPIAEGSPFHAGAALTEIVELFLAGR